MGLSSFIRTISSYIVTHTTIPLFPLYRDALVEKSFGARAAICVIFLTALFATPRG
jgi:hypothetical protein